MIKRKWTNAASFAIASLFFFGYGLGVGIYKWPPHNQLKAIKAAIVAPPEFHYRDGHFHATTTDHSAPELSSLYELEEWQVRMRHDFSESLPYTYDSRIDIELSSTEEHSKLKLQEFHVNTLGRMLFRYFRLSPADIGSDEQLPVLLAFMGHGNVQQVISDPSSYQKAFAASFAENGYIVYVMENAGMETGHDWHLDIDADLRLEGKSWYSMLFAHQTIMINRALSDPQVDPQRTGAAGVSTGGLLALSSAAQDPRITAVSAQGIFGRMHTSFVVDRIQHCHCGAITGLLPKFDLPNLALMVVPRPLQIVNGSQDSFTPMEARQAMKVIEPTLKKLSIPAPTVIVSDGSHEFDTPSAMTFFSHHLRSSATP